MPDRGDMEKEERFPRRCDSCLHWHNGVGTKTCLRCSFYKRFQIKSVRRNQIPVEFLPDAIKNNISDATAHMPEIIEALQLLPADLSAILGMRYISKLDQRTVAGLLQISQPTIASKEAVAVNQLKYIISHEVRDLQANMTKK